MRAFVPAFAALSLAAFAVPATVQAQEIVVPGELSSKDAKEFRKLEKKRLELQGDIVDHEKDVLKARERVSKAEARLADAESDLRQANNKRTRIDRDLSKDRRKLAETEARLAGLRGDPASQLSRR